MRRIDEIITFFHQQGNWVDWDQTRDVVLIGSTERLIQKIGTCWVLTNQALDQAIEQDIHFVISHENCFYYENTKQYRLLLEARTQKAERLKKHDITVYRSHDVWDYVSGFGNLDTFAGLLKLPFIQRPNGAKYAAAYFPRQTVRQIAVSVRQALQGFGQSHCEILGNPNHYIGSLAIGIGAACNVFEMMKMERIDSVLVSDDGACNWIEYQYCLDHNIPVIIVHHSTNEIPGMRRMTGFLQEHFPDLEIVSLTEGYDFTII
ncbi:MAG: Nif3-like dinuclear metal center hexameric protein [Erysipelotrichaceae bacterium]|nr:Nif3-like dinuclear metal center hexameric protein [Erysipelotrichaceae bacterium]